MESIGLVEGHNNSSKCFFRQEGNLLIQGENSLRNFVAAISKLIEQILWACERRKKKSCKKYENKGRVHTNRLVGIPRAAPRAACCFGVENVDGKAQPRSLPNFSSSSIVPGVFFTWSCEDASHFPLGGAAKKIRLPTLFYSFSHLKVPFFLLINYPFTSVSISTNCAFFVRLNKNTQIEMNTFRLHS